MSSRRPRSPNAAQIDALVAHFVENEHIIRNFLEQVLVHIRGSKKLAALTHSLRSRVKEPSHLKDKLNRKLEAAKAAHRDLDITTANLFTSVTDLAGVRILHLHTSQVADIDRELKAIVTEQKLELLDVFARTWDDEYREYFTSIGIRTETSPTLYTSVHYVIASGSRTTITCEIQVRTLMEEVWGEVDHTVNYPHPHESVACKEQIRALARATSSATRLVDSIFATAADIERQKQKSNKKPKAKAKTTR